eukprot:2976193-Pleurochrysis_carterae.AAC.5
MASAGESTVPLSLRGQHVKPTQVTPLAATLPTISVAPDLVGFRQGPERCSCGLLCLVADQTMHITNELIHNPAVNEMLEVPSTLSGRIRMASVSHARTSNRVHARVHACHCCRVCLKIRSTLGRCMACHRATLTS